MSLRAIIDKSLGDRPAAKGRIRQRQEGAILKAAEKVFARAGYQGATLNEIAETAGVPKPTLHYYFSSKEALYRAVLDNILALWLAETDTLTVDADPAAALEHYVRAKMRLSAERPDASRVFANEILHGAGHIGDFLRSELRELVRDRADIIARWVADGRIAPVDGTHLFFTLWAATQTYADFDSQICAVLGKARQTAADHARATDHVLTVVMRTCGLPWPRTDVPPTLPEARHTCST